MQIAKNASMICPAFEGTVVKIPQPDGSFLVKPGKLVPKADYVSTREFSKATGISQRYIRNLCEQGLLKHRRLTPKPTGKILIFRAELERYRDLEGEI